MLRLAVLFATFVFMAGCTPPAATGVLTAPPQDDDAPFSLFSGESDGLDEAMVARLLNAEVDIPEAARLAVLQLPSRALTRPQYYGTIGSEAGAREAYLDTLRAQLLPADVREVEFLPALLVPAQPTVPVLREVAVRLQADALLVFRLSGDLYQNYRAFRSNQIKAYATCEAVLLDVRTGAIPFTTVVTQEYATQKQEADLTDADAQRRAEQQAVLLALGEMGQKVAGFLHKR